MITKIEKVYLTEYIDYPSMDRYEGQDIFATSSQEAKRIANSLNLTLIGRLIETQFVSGENIIYEGQED